MNIFKTSEAAPLLFWASRTPLTSIVPFVWISTLFFSLWAQKEATYLWNAKLGFWNKL